MKRFTYFLLLALFTFSFVQVNAQSQKNDHKATLIITSETMVEVPSIASQIEDGTFIPSEDIKKEVNPKRWGKNTYVPGKGLPKGEDPLVQQQLQATKSQGKAPLLTFDAATASATPTDPTGAVGPNHFVNSWNSSFRIWNKSGSPLTNAASLATIFPGSMGDPIVMYDRYADRFFISEFYSNGFYVAVSQGPDPVNDGWYTYTYPTSSFPDYPKFNVWSDGYYITANKDQGSPTTSEVVFALERDAMLTGDPTAQMIGFSLPGIVLSGFYSPAGFNCNGPNLPPAGNAPIVYMQDDGWTGVSTDHLKIWSINVNWTSPGSSTISSPQTISTDVSPFDGVFDGGSFSNLPQPSGSDIDALQATIMYMAQYRRFSGYNSAVFNFVVNVDASGDYAGIRWYELRQNSDGAPWYVYQEGTYSQPAGRSVFSGNMCMDANGNIALAYTTVSTSVYPSLRYTGRMSGDPLGVMTIAEDVIGNGNASDPSFRYGDYSQMTIDPTDDATFWSIGEYFPGGTRTNRVGVFQLAPGAIAANFSGTPTTVQAGNTVTFTDLSSGTPNSWSWSFPGGTPSSASTQGPHTITYNTVGTYDVSLAVGDGVDTDTETKTNYISVFDCSVSTYPYTQNFDAFTTSLPAFTCTADGTVGLSECWTNVTGDNIDWDVLTGATGSSGTGPTADHTGGGNYLYTETSSCYNSTGYVTSPVFDLSAISTPELRFWYHLYGGSMGTLSVQVSTDGGGVWSGNIWSLNGDQGNAWQEAVISLNAYTTETDLVVRFTGLTGTSYTSDMAIDDFSIDGGMLPGENCSNPQDLTGLTSPYSATTTGYANDFSFCVMGSAPDRIFYVDVLDGYTVEIWQSWNNFDSRHTMRYGGTCPGTTEIACVDDGDYDPIIWENTTGSTQRVWFIVSGYSANFGDFTLEWTLTPPPTPPCSGDIDIDGAGTTTWNYPLSTYYHDARTTSIYLATEFGCSGGTITSMQYYVSTVPGQTMNAFTIRLKHIAAGSYATGNFETTGWTTVYQANETISGTGWYTFNFTTPFTFNGIDNIEIDVCFNNGGYTTDGYVYYFNSGANRSKYYRCDGCSYPTTDPLTWTNAGSLTTNVPRAIFTFGSSVTCETIPYTQDFENGGAWPTDWSTDNANVWEINTTWTGSYPPGGYHVFSDYSPYETGTVNSPCFDGTGKSNLHVRFFHYWQADYSGATQNAYFRGSPDGGTTWYLIDEWHHNNPPTEEGWKIYNISSWADGYNNIVFEWEVSHNNDWYWVWDDFTIQEGDWGTPGLWTGNTSTDWNTYTNWTNLAIPNSYDNVTIPSIATNWPTFTGDFELGVSCNNMTLDGSSEFTVTGDITIPTGYTLTSNSSSKIVVEGDWNKYGDFIPGAGTVEFIGAANSIISGIPFKTIGDNTSNTIELKTFNPEFNHTVVVSEIESDPVAKPRTVPPSDATWDLQFSYDVDTPSGLTGIAGSETDGTYLYGTKWSGTGEIVKFDLAGNYIETFTIPGVVNVRDLAYDGQYFYGSDAGSYIYEMDFVSKTLVTTITTPAAVRAIAYDSDLDGFWYNNFATDLHFVNRSGTLLNTITAPPSMYGCTYDNLSSGGPFLWIFTGTTTGGGCQVEQYDLSTKTLTGITHSVSGDLGAYIAGGLWLQPNLVSGTYTLGGMAQGTPDLVFGYELGTSNGFFNLIDNKSNAEVIVNNTIAVSNNLIVRPGAYLTNNIDNLVDVSGNVLLEADDTGMASFIDNGTTNVGGSIEVEQYITELQWHLVSPPISDAEIGVYYDIYLKEYNEPTDTWTYLVDPTTIPMNETQGYSTWPSDQYTGTTIVTYSGTLNAVADYPLTSLSYTSGAPNAGFNLIGNPYPCSIDWNTNWSMSNMSGWMVVYDNGTFNGMHTDGIPYNGKTNGLVQSTQGFWVRAMNASASLTIPASERQHSNEAFLKGATEIIYPTVSLQSNINEFTDEATVIFHPDCTPGFDGYYDLTKFMNIEEAPTLYTIASGKDYAMNFYEEEYLDVVVPVGFETGVDGIYTVTASNIANFDDAVNVYLEDLLSGIVTNLNENPQYEFSYDPQDDAHRFNLHFKESWYGIEDNIVGNINIYSANDYVYIVTPEMESGDVFIYDMLGQEILHQKISESDMTKIRVTSGSAHYLVKFQSDEIFITEKIFIK